MFNIQAFRNSKMHTRGLCIVCVLQKFLDDAKAILISINKVGSQEGNNTLGIYAHLKFVCHIYISNVLS